MKRLFKKSLALLLALTMVFGAAPLAGLVGLELPSLKDVFTEKAEAATYGNLTYEISNGKVTITDCNTSASGDLVIPETIEGCPVTIIGYRAFENCTGLTNITIPDSVTSIGNNVFNNCTNLTSITVSENNQCYSNDEYGVLFNKDKTELIQYPIGNTRNTYSIPNSVTSISECAFSGCNGLTIVTISDSVKSIGNSAFYECPELESVYYTGDVASWCSIDFNGPYSNPMCCANVLNINGKKVEGELVIPEGVKSIGGSAFYRCEEVTGVTIPNSVTNIGSCAFNNCTGLTSVTIPNSVNSIGKDAFFNTGLYNDSSNWENDVLYIGNQLIAVKTTISGKYKIKTGTKTIADGSFLNCSGLTSVIIPDGVTSICSTAFSWCTGLTDVTIGNSVTSIGSGAFHLCKGLERVYYTGNIADWCSIDFNSYHSNPMYYASNLYISEKKVEGDFVIPDGVTSISDYAFCNFTGLTSVTIPDSVTTIGKCAFRNCAGLTSVTIPDSVTNIGKDAFYNTRIYNKSSNWENDVLYIGNHLIVAKSTIPDNYNMKPGTKTIADNAFSGCSGLTSVTIPNSVKSIGRSAFNDCTKLTNVYYGGNSDEWKEIKTEDGNDNLNSASIEYSEYKVKWISNENEEQSFFVKVGDKIEAPASPIKSGYIFSGWSPKIPETMPKNDLEFNAMWNAKTDTAYTVETYTMYVNGEYVKTIESKQGTTGTEVSVDADVPTGFALNSLKSVLSGIISGDGSLVLSIYYDRNTYSFSTIVDGVTTEAEYLYGSIIAEPTTPVKTGYTFTGWDKTIPATMPAEDFTVTAQFTPNSYDAVFNANGGKWSDGSTAKTVVTDFDCEIVAPENPSRQGYDFAGWTPSVEIMDDVNGKSFSAQWTARNDTEYTVETYTMDIYGKYSVVKETKNGTTDTEASVTANAQHGFTINSAKSKLSGNIAGDGSLVLSVYYDRITYRLTTVVEGQTTSSSYYFDAPVTMPANPVKPGYKFIGWDKTIPSKMPANDVTVTAKFELSFKMSIRNPSTTTIKYGDKIILHADMNEALPSGWTVKWTADNGNFSYSVSADGSTCTISPSKSGSTNFKATVYDEKGNVFCEDTQSMTSKAGFFDKIGAFFRKLFGSTKTIPKLFKGIF